MGILTTKSNTTGVLRPVIQKDTERNLITLSRSCQDILLSQFSLRSYMMNIDRSYMMEKDWTEAQLKARLANMQGDASKIQDVTVPIVMPQVEASLGYMVNTFCTGEPIFGVTADPQYESQAMQMEAIISENSTRGGWARELMLFFRDGLKYNLHALEVSWEQRTTYNIKNDATSPNGAKPSKTIWAGNVIRRIDMYNVFMDPRVHPAKIASEGEFAGYVQVMSRIRLKQFISEQFGELSKAVVTRAFESSPVSAIASNGTPFSYYIPLINPFPLMNRSVIGSYDWMAYAAGQPQRPNAIRYTNAYEVSIIYIRLLPDDFGLPLAGDADTPQVWKLTIVNNTVVLAAERLSNVHNYIPIFFGQPLEDGLDYQTKSFAQNVMPMQDIASAMWNGYIASKRRLITDRVLYDPMKVNKKDISSTDPAAKIPVRSSAYGTDISKAVYAFPYRDDNADSLLNGATLVQRYSDLINGQNPAQQGQFVKGNKTKHEYDDVMGHGNNKNQSMALMSEYQVFVPVKDVLRLNILQFQGDTSLYSPSAKSQIQISATDLRTAAVHFKVSDGLVPADKLMNGDDWTVTMQTVGTPGNGIGDAFDKAGMFTYLMQTRGVDLSPFAKSPLQLQFEQQQASWQQVALGAMKMGKEPPPQPQMPPALVQELQAKQQQGPSAGVTSSALESTQGGGSPPAQKSQPTQQGQ